MTKVFTKIYKVSLKHPFHATIQVDNNFITDAAFLIWAIKPNKVFYLPLKFMFTTK